MDVIEKEEVQLLKTCQHWKKQQRFGENGEWRYEHLDVYRTDFSYNILHQVLRFYLTVRDEERLLMAKRPILRIVGLNIWVATAPSCLVGRERRWTAAKVLCIY